MILEINWYESLFILHGLMGPKDTARGNQTMTAAAAEVKPHRRRFLTPARLCLGCKDRK